MDMNFCIKIPVAKINQNLIFFYYLKKKKKKILKKLSYAIIP